MDDGRVKSQRGIGKDFGLRSPRGLCFVVWPANQNEKKKETVASPTHCRVSFRWLFTWWVRASPRIFVMPSLITRNVRNCCTLHFSTYLTGLEIDRIVRWENTGGLVFFGFDADRLKFYGGREGNRGTLGQSDAVILDEARQSIKVQPLSRKTALGCSNGRNRDLSTINNIG